MRGASRPGDQKEKAVIYQEVEQRSQAEIDRMLESESGEDVIQALLSLVFFGEDWKVSQNVCVGFLEYRDLEVARIAVLGIGHTARIHGKIGASVLEALKRSVRVKELSGTVGDALDDIEAYVREEPIHDHLSD